VDSPRLGNYVTGDPQATRELPDGPGRPLGNYVTADTDYVTGYRPTDEERAALNAAWADAPHDGPGGPSHSLPRETAEWSPVLSRTLYGLKA